MNAKVEEPHQTNNDSSSDHEGHHQPISEWTVGALVSGVYLVSKSELKSRANGADYLVVTLADATGECETVFWDDAESLVASGFGAPGTFLSISGKVVDYRGSKNLKRSHVSFADEPKDLAPYRKRVDESCVADFAELVCSIEDTDLREIVESVFALPGLWDSFCRAPAAKKHHDARAGGLIAHTVKVAKNALAIAKNYPEIDVDLVVAGALVHDVGKTVEYTIDFTGLAIDKHPFYGMNGHIVEGLKILARATQHETIEKRRNWVDFLSHVIASHHGRQEYGSPCVPQVVEAMVVFYADLADCYVSSWRELVEKSQPGADKSQYSEVHRAAVWVSGTPGQRERRNGE